MKRLVWTFSLCLLIGTASAEDITIFDANDVITSADTYDTVVVRGDGTVVDMTGGSITKLIVMNSARVNISDGTIASVLAYDSGTIDAVGGNMTGQWNVCQNASVYIAGTTNAGEIRLYQDSSIVMNSPAAMVSSMYMYDRLL